MTTNNTCPTKLGKFTRQPFVEEVAEPWSRIKTTEATK